MKAPLTLCHYYPRFGDTTESQYDYTRRPWLTKLLQRRSTKIAAIALANKIARTAWAMMAHETVYKEPAPQVV